MNVVEQSMEDITYAQGDSVVLCTAKKLANKWTIKHVAELKCVCFVYVGGLSASLSS